LHAREANQIKQWRDQLLEGATGVFCAAPKSEVEPVIDVKTLHAKIGELALGPVFCPARSARRVCCPVARQRMPACARVARKKMIDRTSKLSVSRQAGVLGISRGSVYYQPRPVSDADLKLMHRIRRPAVVCVQTTRGDKLHMEFPFAPSQALLRNTLPGNGRLDVAGPAGARRGQGGPVARRDPDETVGCRSAHIA
jgi:hypothetical protein